MPSAYDNPRKSEYRYGGVAERKAAEIEDKTLPLSYRRRGKKKRIVCVRAARKKEKEARNIHIYTSITF